MSWFQKWFFYNSTPKTIVTPAKPSRSPRATKNRCLSFLPLRPSICNCDPWAHIQSPHSQGYPSTHHPYWASQHQLGDISFDLNYLLNLGPCLFQILEEGPHWTLFNKVNSRKVQFCIIWEDVIAEDGVVSLFPFPPTTNFPSPRTFTTISYEFLPRQVPFNPFHQRVEEKLLKKIGEDKAYPYPCRFFTVYDSV